MAELPATEEGDSIPTAANPRPSAAGRPSHSTRGPPNTGPDGAIPSEKSEASPTRQASGKRLSTASDRPSISSPTIPSPSPVSQAAKKSSTVSQNAAKQLDSIYINPLQLGIPQVEVCFIFRISLKWKCFGLHSHLPKLKEPSADPLGLVDTAEADPFQDPTASEDVAYPPTQGTGYGSDTDAVLVQPEDADDVPELDIEVRAVDVTQISLTWSHDLMLCSVRMMWIPWTIGVQSPMPTGLSITGMSSQGRQHGNCQQIWKLCPKENLVNTWRRWLIRRPHMSLIPHIIPTGTCWRLGMSVYVEQKHSRFMLMRTLFGM